MNSPAITDMSENRPASTDQNRSGAWMSMPWWLALVATFILITIGPGEIEGAAEEKAKDPSHSPAAKIVARVNEEPILEADLQRSLASSALVDPGRLNDGDEASTRNELRHQALQDLIDRQLFLQEARNRALDITEKDVDQAISSFRKNFKNIESLGTWMHQRGLDDTSLFDAIREGLLINRVMAALVNDVKVSEIELQRYYDKHKENLIVGEEVRLRMIVVRDLEKADSILKALKSGESFSQLAYEKSLGLRARQGGDTGWVNVSALSPMLRDVVNVLKPGDVAGPLQKNPEEFLLVGLEDRRSVKASSLKNDRHTVEKLLLAEKQREAIQDWLAEQKSSSDIEILLFPDRAVE